MNRLTLLALGSMLSLAAAGGFWSELEEAEGGQEEHPARLPPALPFAPGQPEAWPDSFFASELRNGSTPAGESTGPPQQILKYYDAPRLSMLQECSREGVTSSFLIRGTDSWVFNEQNQACEYLQLPVGIVTQDWFVGGAYEGTQVVNSVLSNKWVTQDHEYYETVEHPKRPTRVVTPLDQKGNKNQEDYGVFQPMSFEDNFFEVPAYCPSAQEQGEARISSSSGGDTSGGALLERLWDWLMSDSLSPDDKYSITTSSSSSPSYDRSSSSSFSSYSSSSPRGGAWAWEDEILADPKECFLPVSAPTQPPAEGAFLVAAE